MLVKLVKIVINQIYKSQTKRLSLSCLYTPQLDQLICVTEEEARYKTQQRKYHGNCYIHTY